MIVNTNIIVIYCCKQVLLYAKMQKETETKETTGFVVTFLSLVAFKLGGVAATFRPSPWLRL